LNSLLQFTAGSEIVLILFKDDKIYCKSSMTYNQFVELTPQLFKPNRQSMAKMEYIIKVWPSLDLQARIIYMKQEFGKMGYELKNFIEDSDGSVS